jgi:hypothetical protein
MRETTTFLRPAGFAFGLLILLSFGQAPAFAGFCVGVNCGLSQLQGSHCHSVNAQGNQCWDEFDDTCEAIPGFSVMRGEAAVCAVGGTPGIGIGGTIAAQAATAFGGYTQFRSQVARSAAPRISEVRQAAEAEEGSAFHFSEIVAALEQEQWDLFGAEGETNGLRLGWNRQTETGVLFGASGSYQEAEPDFGGSTKLLNANLNVGHTLGPIWKWSAGVNLSDISGDVDNQLYGAGAQIHFANYFDNGHVFSGGLITQWNAADDDAFDQDIITAGAGIAYGLPLGERFTLDLDGYAINVLDPEVPDDLFYLIGAQLGVYLSPRLALNLGYRVLEGLDGLDSGTITLGAAHRWN